jgi:hypothetical protein
LIFFEKFGEYVQCLFGAAWVVVYFGEVCQHAVQFFLPVVLEADQHELFGHNFLLDDLIVLAIVFKRPICACKRLLFDRVGERYGYFEDDFVVAGVGVCIGLFYEVAAGVVLKAPEYEVVASEVEGKDDKKEYCEELSHNRLGVWVYEVGEMKCENQA